MATSRAEQRAAKMRAAIDAQPKLISLAEAAFKGIDRVRDPKWANSLDHLKIDIVGHAPGIGPWAHLYAPFNRKCNGRDPVDILLVMHKGFDIFERGWEHYTGPLPDSDEYKAAVAAFDGVDLGK